MHKQHHFQLHIQQVIAKTAANNAAATQTIGVYFPAILITAAGDKNIPEPMIELIANKTMDQNPNFFITSHTFSKFVTAYFKVNWY